MEAQSFSSVKYFFEFLNAIIALGEEVVFFPSFPSASLQILEPGGMLQASVPHALYGTDHNLARPYFLVIVFKDNVSRSKRQSKSCGSY